MTVQALIDALLGAGVYERYAERVEAAHAALGAEAPALAAIVAAGWLEERTIGDRRYIRRGAWSPEWEEEYREKLKEQEHGEHERNTPAG